MVTIDQEQHDSAHRVAIIRSALTTAIIAVVRDNPDTTYEELLEGLSGITYRYAQHLRASDSVPVELPHPEPALEQQPPASIQAQVHEAAGERP